MLIYSGSNLTFCSAWSPILPRERESQMLNTRVFVIQNPWSHRVPLNILTQILTEIAEKRAEHIESSYRADDETGEHNFTFVILDPAAPRWKPSAEAILAIVLIGPNAVKLIPNAIAKAVWHRDHGQLAGYGAYVDTLTAADGDFAWGFSCQVDNTIGGGSGLTQEADAYEVGIALVEFNFEIRSLEKNWFESQKKRPGWFCNADEPGEQYRAMTHNAITGALYDSGIYDETPAGNDV